MVYTVVDLFSGAGGFSLAAKNEGGTVVFGVENDRHAASTYRRNIADADETVLYESDIMQLSAQELAVKHFGPGNGCDLLLGGPPCQGFSTHRTQNAGVDDARNSLIYRYFDFVEALQPKAFLMENVPGILADRHAEYLKTFYGLGAASNYEVLPPVKVDARDYGVPQRRTRVFVLGVRSDLDAPSLMWPPSPSHSADGKAGRPLWLDCSHVFSSAPPNDINDVHMTHGPELVEAFKNTPPNGGSRKDSGRVLPCHSRHGGHSDVYGRIDPNAPAPTMTAGCVNPSKGRFVHPTEHHGITARQAARIQGFPDSFSFLGGLMAASKQIGNAVPIGLGVALIRALKPVLEVQPPAFYQLSLSAA